MGYKSKSTVLGAKPHLPPSLTPPSRQVVNSDACKKEVIMKDFGTAKAFDAVPGQIKFEAAGDAPRFETTAIVRDKQTLPVGDRGPSYDLGTAQGQRS
jgi:hypothetical protein